MDINPNFNIGSSRGLNFLGTYLVVCVVTLHNLNMSLFVFSACRLNNLCVSVTQEIHEHWVPKTMMIPQYSGPILPKPNLPWILVHVPYFYFAVFPHKPPIFLCIAWFSVVHKYILASTIYTLHALIIWIIIVILFWLMMGMLKILWGILPSQTNYNYS